MKDSAILAWNNGGFPDEAERSGRPVRPDLTAFERELGVIARIDEWTIDVDRDAGTVTARLSRVLGVDRVTFEVLHDGYGARVSVMLGDCRQGPGPNDPDIAEADTHGERRIIQAFRAAEMKARVWLHRRSEGEGPAVLRRELHESPSAGGRVVRRVGPVVLALAGCVGVDPLCLTAHCPPTTVCDDAEGCVTTARTADGRLHRFAPGAVVSVCDRARLDHAHLDTDHDRDRCPRCW